MYILTPISNKHLLPLYKWGSNQRVLAAAGETEQQNVNGLDGYWIQLNYHYDLRLGLALEFERLQTYTPYHTVLHFFVLLIEV